MQDHPSPGTASPSLPGEEYVDRAVLGVVLERHPAHVAFVELVDELVHACEHPVMSEELVRDGVARLVGAGLARRRGDLVLATRAAVRFAELGL
jgi:DNA-binding transcriptional regulator PaaX